MKEEEEVGRREREKRRKKNAIFPSWVSPLI